MRRYGYLLMVGWFILGGCSEFQQAVKDAKKEIPPAPKDNYMVLLDLSDRILYNNQQQVPKDIAVIKSIYGLYKARLNSKDPTHLYYALRDKLKVLIAPQRTTPKSLYDMVGSLRIDLSAEQPDKKSALTDETEKTFGTVLPEIYKEAVIGNNSTAYSGADIWKYFNEDLSDDLEKDAQNTLFIVTDGYMDLQKSEERPAQNNRVASCSQIINSLKKYPDWEARFTEGDYGLLPIAKKFSSLKVVVLQVNPKDDWNGEYSLLTKIWGKWFTEMGITNYRFIKDDNTSEVKESLEKFMDVKIAGKTLPESWTKITTVDSSLMMPLGTDSLSKELTSSTIAEPKSRPALSKTIANRTQYAAQILPPDESASNLFVVKKKAMLSLPKKSTAIQDDILKDGTPVNGFNTGIKKETSKEPLLTGNRKQ